MSIRFRRRINLGKGLNLNLGKKSAGLSIGGRGARLGIGSRGVYRSFSIPGTGLYSIDYMGKDSKSGQRSQEKGQAKREGAEDILPMPAELKEFNYPIIFLLLGISLLPFQIIVGIIFLGGYFYSARKLGNSPKGKARKEFKQGKTALKNGDYRSALTSFQSVLKNQPVKDLYPLVAALLLREAEYEQAVKMYENYLKLEPGDSEIMANYAIALKRLEKYDEAIEILQRLLKEEDSKDDKEQDEDNRLRILSALGDCFLKQGKPEMALEVLKSGPVRARKLDSQERMYYKYLLGAAYMKAEEEERALTHLKRVYAHDKSFMEVESLVNQLEEDKARQA